MSEKEPISRDEHDLAHGGVVKRLDNLEQDVRLLESRLNQIELEQSGSIREIKVTLSVLSSQFAEFARKLEEIQRRPSRLWDGAVLAVISAIIGALVRGLVK